MNSLLTLRITDKIYRNDYVEERTRQIIKFSIMIILFRVFYFSGSILGTFINNDKIIPGYQIWSGCYEFCNVSILLISLRFKNSTYFHALLQVLIFIGNLRAFSFELISVADIHQKAIAYGFYLICAILLNMSWILTAVAIIVNLVGIIIFTMLHDNTYDVSTILQITFISLLVICAIYYSEKQMKESFLMFKQNENLNNDLNNLLVNLPQPFLLFDQNKKEAVLANDELYNLLSISQNKSLIDMSKRLSQKILEPYNYIVGLGDEEKNQDSNIQIESTSGFFQQKFDLFETIQINQTDSYYSIDTTYNFQEDIPSQKSNNPRGSNLNKNQKIGNLKNELQQGMSSLNPEQSSSKTSSNDCIYKEIVSMKVKNLHFQGRDLKMIVFNRITSFVNNERQKMENNFIEMITATISHDMRTPINSITGLIQSLEKFVPQQEGKKVLSVINNSSKTILFLVNDILDYFQIKHGIFHAKTQNCNIFNTVNEMIDMFQLFAIEKKIVLKSEFDSNLPLYLHVDSQRIQQVLNNLLQNALKFTTYGSVKIVVSYNRIDKLVNFKVIDTGVGIKPLEQKRLFKLFGKFDNSLAVNTKGIGLGLNVCKKIVNECGGNIYLESSYKNGASFCFSMNAKQVKSSEIIDHQSALTIKNYQGRSQISEKYLSCEQDLSLRSFEMQMLSPIKMPNIDPYTIESLFKPRALFPVESDNLREENPTVCFCSNKPRILIVDDNVFNIITLQTILEMQFGLQVDKATNGLEAVEKVIERQNQNQSGTPQCSCNYSTSDSYIRENDQEVYKVIFMDCNMPIMDGFEATKEIRKLQNMDQSDMKIIALTANTNKSLQDQCFESGMDQFLSKPIEFNQLRQVLIDNGLYDE
eukprot:403344478